MLARFFRRLKYILSRKRSESELDREIRFHLEMEMRDHVDDGIVPEEARRRSRADFGSVLACKQEVREAWGLRLWYDFTRDLRYALSTMRRRPSFAFLTILTLAVGIGATTAVFAMLDRVLLRPLPFRDSERLVQLWETRPHQEFATMELSYPNFVDWKLRNHVFEDLAGYNGTNFTLTGLGTPERIRAVRVTANMLGILGVRPQMGRDFTAEEDDSQANVTLITHGTWQRRFAGRPDVLGTTLTLNGVPYTIVGVLPPDFRFNLGDSELLVPLGANGGTLQQRARRQFHFMLTIARLKTGITVAAAERETKAIAEQLAREHADTNAGTSAKVIPLHEQLTGNLRPTLLVVFGGAFCMFILALANVTSLLIAQSNFRRREISIRSALGAGTARLGRQLVAECVVFVSVAGLVSLVVGYWTLRGIIFWMPEQWVPLLAATQLDVRSAAFALILTLAAGVFGGAMIAHRFSTATLNDDLKGNRQTSGGRQGLRSAFTVVEIALAVVLIVGAVVMAQSVRRLLSVDPGFRTAQLVSMNLSLPRAQYKEPADVIRFYRDLRESVARMPGVESAAVIDEQPLTTSGGTMHVLVYGQDPPQPGHEPESVIRSASPHYFETMGIRLIRGRTFADTDSASGRKVVVLSEMLADRLFGTADPVGQRIVFPFDKSMWDIVGVVGDVHLSGLDLGILPTLYTCSLQDPSTSSVLMVRTGLDPASVAATVRGQVQRMNAELPVYGFRSMDRTIDNTAGVSTRKLVLYLVTAFSGIGALMAGIGLYSLLTFVVAQRSKEIGIRMALGARGATIGKMVLRQVLSMTGLGLAVGTIAAVAGTRLIQAVLFGVSPSSPSTLLIVALLTAAVAGAACCAPVVRAARMDPNTVLRND